MASNLGSAINLLFRTWPFVALKIIVYLGISIGFLVLAGIILGLLFFIKSWIAFIFIFATLAAAWTTAKFLRTYITYMLKAGHIAVLAEIIKNNRIPEGTNQITYGFSKVKERFVTANVFFAIDELINMVAGQITGFINRIGSAIPAENIRLLINLLSRLVGIVVSYIDEAIIGYIFINPEKDVLNATKDGLILYSKVWKSLFTSAAVIVVLTYVLTAVTFVVAIMPAIVVASLLPDIFFIRDLTIFIALAFAFFVKTALLDQFILVYMVTTYNNSIKDKTPDSEAVRRLEEMVPKFKDFIEQTADKIKKAVGVNRDAQPNINAG